jgi:HEAT repeat protein
MRRAAWAGIVVVACAHNGVDSMVEPRGDRDAEVEMQIILLETPFGDGPHQRERERAAAWLVAHAERAYPRVLALLDEDRAGVGVIDLLPSFDRAESIPSLTRLLAGPEHTAWTAGQALARHTNPEAGEALRRALSSPDPEVAIIAADALMTRNDRGDCAALATAVGAADARVRYHALQAAGRLRCLERSTLESLVRADASAEVRDLAARLLKQR